MVFGWMDGHLTVVSVETMAVAVVAKTVSVGAVSKTVSVSMAVVSVVGISLGLSISSRLGLSGPLAVVSKTVSVVAKTGVSVVSKTVSVGVSKTVSVGVAVVSVVGIGISLGLSNSGGLSLIGPLAVVVTVVAKTVSVSVVAKTVSVGTVSKTVVSKAVVSVVGIGINLGLGIGQSHGKKASKNEKLHIGCSFTEC